MEQLNLSNCLAKTFNNTKPGVNVLTHCVIVGLVAKELLKRFSFLSDHIDPDSVLLVALHDIGKISPTFQMKLYKKILSNKISCNNCLSKFFGKFNKIEDKDVGYHTKVGSIAIKAINNNDYVAEVIGRHHGSSPSDIKGDPNGKIYGGKDWQTIRMELFNELQKWFGNIIPDINNNIDADKLSGLVCVADWIGSGIEGDHLNNLVGNADKVSLNKIVIKAVNETGYIQPEINPNQTFKSIFNFEHLESQKEFYQTVASSGKGVYVLEAPTGVGKTEAALMAGYKLMEKGLASGLYFALPTQITSNKIHERVVPFFEKIISNKENKVLLTHSMSSFFLDIDEDGEKSWFDTSKKALLSPFAVGTVDQALMSALNVRHNFVRTFGLINKVVILDEIHSYDSYTGTILDELVKRLRELGCTVIILTATLTSERKKNIIGTADFNEPFPLISSYTDNSYKTIELKKFKDHTINLNINDDENNMIASVINKAISGQQILWIENTISEAQSVYGRISSQISNLNIECGLIHSAFLKYHRTEKEEKWINLFGKGGINNRYEKGRILVATQVVEQSVDIDADFLVTRLCPMDMLIQRAGRLWRHSQNNCLRPKEADRAVHILSPTLNDLVNDCKIIGKSWRIYSEYVLCRTLKVLENLNQIILPSMSRNLLENTYSDIAETGNMAAYKQDFETRRNTLRNFANQRFSKDGKTDSDANAPTRYADIISVDVLLFKKIIGNNNSYDLTLYDNTEITVSKDPDFKQKKTVAKELIKNTVRVAEYNAPETSVNNPLLNILKDYLYVSEFVVNNKTVPSLRVALLNGTSLKGIKNEKIHKNNLSYNFNIGYWVS